MPTLVYKRTHNGDPEEDSGEFGCYGCMGCYGSYASGGAGK